METRKLNSEERELFNNAETQMNSHRAAYGEPALLPIFGECETDGKYLYMRDHITQLFQYDIEKERIVFDDEESEAVEQEEKKLDTDQDVNQFFCDEIEKVNERIDLIKKRIEMERGCLKATEITLMCVNPKEWSIAENIKNATATMQNSVVAGMYAETRNLKLESIVDDQTKKIKTLEKKLKELDKNKYLFADDIYGISARITNASDALELALNSQHENRFDDEAIAVFQMVKDSLSQQAGRLETIEENIYEQQN